MAVLHVASDQTAEISWRPSTLPVSSLKPVVPTSAWGSRTGQLIWIPAGRQAFLLGFSGLFVHNSSTFCHLLLFIRWLKVLVLKKHFVFAVNDEGTLILQSVVIFIIIRKLYICLEGSHFEILAYISLLKPGSSLVLGSWMSAQCPNHYRLLGKTAICNVLSLVSSNLVICPKL